MFDLFSVIGNTIKKTHQQIGLAFRIARVGPLGTYSCVCVSLTFSLNILCEAGLGGGYG